MSDSSPAPIFRLPRNLANQIAAGEVIERPSSVVKELLENSLDAGAKRIEIEIERGGSKRIRVTDDGAGIRSEDLPLALSRHATSKLRETEQLASIQSLGFRGEALASIGSVARLEMTSRPRDAEMAWQLDCEESRISSTRPAAHPAGTTVVVEDLFAGLPARRKFLRTERTEFMHIEHLVQAMALSRFDVGFTLTHNQRLVRREAPAMDRRAMERRLARICGRSFLDNALTLDFSTGKMRLWGWIGKPVFSRNQTDLQYFFVNGRLVRDRTVSHAIREAYQDLLPAGRYPGFVLHFDLDTIDVDVNVHPTKHEVRFREARLVHDFLAHCLHQALLNKSPSDITLVSGEFPSAPDLLADETMQYGQSPSHDAASFYADVPAIAFRILGQLHGGYLVLESESGLALLDIAAAKAELVIRQILMSLDQGVVKSQPLLIPVTLDLPLAQVESLEKADEWLSQLGLEINRIAISTIMVRRIPALLGDVEVRMLIEAILAMLKDDPDHTRPLHEKVTGLVSGCEFQPETQMSTQEMENLLQALARFGLDRPGVERPVILHLTEEEIERRFRAL